MPALEWFDRACPTPAGDAQPLIQHLAAGIEMRIQRLELLTQPAHPHAQHEASAGDGVDARRLLRKQDRIAHGQDQDGGAQLGLPCGGGHGAQRDDRFQIVDVNRPCDAPVRRKRVTRSDLMRKNHVVARPDRIEPCRFQHRGHPRNTQTHRQRSTVRHLGAEAQGFAHQDASVPPSTGT